MTLEERKTMDYKEGMTCGECLKYAFCPVANYNANHKACMKITTKENYTIEQNEDKVIAWKEIVPLKENE